MARRAKYNDPNQKSLIPLFDAESFAEDIKDIIANSIIDKGRSATGKAVKSLSVRTNGDEGFYICAVPYISKIQAGNPPNRGNRAYFGKGRHVAKPVVVLASRLREGWLQSRNLDDSLAFPIAQSIVSKGDLTYQKGGEDVWETNVSDFINENLDKYINIEQYLNIDL